MSDASVLAYFGDGPERVYQFLQWLPVLDVLDQSQPVNVVLRDPGTAAVVRPRTGLPVLVAEPFAELRALYAELDAAVGLYCNNSPRNFESLLEPRMLHVHVSHGESDKHSSASNNAKAYDRVFVAGEAAVQRYRHGLLDFDTDRLVRIGRPQLDLRPPAVLPPSSRRTVIYAPTFEGDADYNNYSSIDVLGPEIVGRLLAVPDVRLVYKPHPRIPHSQDPFVRSAHREVVRLVTEATERDPGAWHAVLEDADILAVLPDCDAMVTDVSSVGLDWLYLRTDQPLFVVDRHEDIARLHAEVPVSQCADVVDSTTVAGLGDLVAARLEHDELRPARAAMRRHYFDDVAVGESTTRFVDAVRDLVSLRDRLLEAKTETGALN
ncbi:MAG TPA: CDP-glycerol glycerophosphotransferase family protein [Nocardioides sp.]|uniref:CDP-glycerol glycerophosphotransferase family protein n=1 Tax=Nocardioides sp. TaxID=35761 RepID=UPI002E3807AA|nr:CDP-glycerol glycerophosphotransferase family protein [Nocardioides sp.]HEX5089799.1 CDP-glycerol glycerophosphotransferase family protein [Nocardioides sp.]